MGSGKSVVGKSLARKLNWPFVDTDGCIEESAGMPISEIFETKGEPFFRSMEKDWVKKTAQLTKHVVSLGGGAVMDEENWETIAESGITITLYYPPEILAKRLYTKKDRPMISKYEGEERVKRINDLLSIREHVYRRADLVFEMNVEIQVEAVASSLAEYVRGRV
jgi:shikimate kinase